MADLRPGARLALDWGQARIGVAACDPAGTLAYPVEAVPAGPGAIARIVALVGEYEPIELVVGLPRSLSGGEGPAAATVRSQVAELVSVVAPLPVRLVDERLTTVTAAQRLREGGRSAKKQRSRIDAAAAAAILEHALDSERHVGYAAWRVTIDRGRARLAGQQTQIRGERRVTSMLDPDVKPSPAREIVHKGKGCLAVLVAAAVLVFGGYLVYDRVGGLLDGWGEVADYPGPGKGSITVTVPEGATVSQIGDVLVENKVVQSEEAWNEAVASRGALHQHPARSLRDADRDAGDRRPHPADQPRRVPGARPVHGAGGSAAVRPGRRPGQGHQDQEVGVREGAGQAEDARPAGVREEPTRGLPVPRHLRADRAGDRHLGAAADDRRGSTTSPRRSTSRVRPRSWTGRRTSS